MSNDNKNLSELFANYCKVCDDELKRLDVMGFKAGDLKDDYWILKNITNFFGVVFQVDEEKEENSSQTLYKWLLGQNINTRFALGSELEHLNDIESYINNETDKEYLDKITELVKKYTELFSDERLPKAFSKLLSEGKDKENLDEDLKEKILFIINAIFEPKLLLYHTQVDKDGRLSSTAIKMSYKLESAFDALKSKVEDFCTQVLE